MIDVTCRTRRALSNGVLLLGVTVIIKKWPAEWPANFTHAIMSMIMNFPFPTTDI